MRPVAEDEKSSAKRPVYEDIMVNEERVKLMTKMAIYEKNEGDRCHKIIQFRRRDYVALCGLVQFFLGTLIFAIGFAGYFFLKLKDVVFEMSWTQMEKLAFKVGVYYLIFTLLYQIFVRLRARFYYNRCLRHAHEFEEGFARLNRLYKREDEFTAPLEYVNNEQIH